jgi:hypothetical protein
MNLIQLFYVEFDRKQKLTNKGIETKGVVQAMTFLTQQTKSLYGEVFPDQIKAKRRNCWWWRYGFRLCELQTDRGKIGDEF